MRVLLDCAAADRGVHPRPGAGSSVLERVAAELRRPRRLRHEGIQFRQSLGGYMVADMKKLALIAALLVATGSPAFAGASNFTLVNGAGGALDGLSIRRSGTNDWKPLAQGAGGAVQFSDPDCAFDIKATVAGAPVTWAGVNLCGAKSVTLKRDAAAGAWVDYDQ